MDEQQQDREKHDDALLQSLADSSQLLEGQPAPVAATPQELSQEHAALVESLAQVRSQNPELEQHLVSHIRQVVKLATSEPAIRKPTGKPAPSSPKPTPPRPGEVLMGPQARPQSAPATPAPLSAPQSPPGALNPQVDADSHFASMELPESPEAPSESPGPIDHAAINRYAQSRKQQWLEAARPQTHQGDFEQDPGWTRPPNMTMHLPELTSDLGSSLKSMEAMFRKIVNSLNEFSRSVNEMQATLNRNGII